MKNFFKVSHNWYIGISIFLFGTGIFLLGGVFVYILLSSPANTIVSGDSNLSLTPLSEKNTIFPEKQPSITINEITDNSVFASSRGSKYYTKFCSAGRSLSQENIIWFMGPKEAEDAGYTLSKSC